MLPGVQARLWNKKMLNQRKKTAKQSLKQRRTKMLCSRFEAISRGKTYGGTYSVDLH